MAIVEPKKNRRKWIVQVSAIASIGTLAALQQDAMMTGIAITAISAIAGIDIRKNGGS